MSCVCACVHGGLCLGMCVRRCAFIWMCVFADVCLYGGVCLSGGVSVCVEVCVRAECVKARVNYVCSRVQRSESSVKGHYAAKSLILCVCACICASMCRHCGGVCAKERERDLRKKEKK